MIYLWIVLAVIVVAALAVWLRRAETRLTLSNIKLILEAAGSSLKDVVKCSVFLADVGDFQAMNEVYTEFFGDAKPARTTVGCAFALAGLHVEIDCIAFSPLGKA